jgi:site-specific recombinase XerD
MPRSKWVRHAVVAAPAPAPALPPRPRGDLTVACIDEIQDIASSVWPKPDSRRKSRHVGLGRLLEHLARFPAGTWQERWEASGLNDRGRPVRDLATGDRYCYVLTQAAEALFSLRVIQPSLAAFRSNKFLEYPAAFRVTQADDRLDSFFQAVETQHTSRLFKRLAVFDVCCALTTQGIAYADLTPEAFLHYSIDTRQGRFGVYTYGNYVGHLAWQVMYDTGHFPRSTPATLRACLRAPQLTADELVDQHGIANPAVRQLLVDYIERRSHDLDYGTTAALATQLVLNFWKALEEINADQQDLRLSQETYQAWRQAIRVRHDGKRRSDEDGILVAVRALYFDLQAWAAQEPERWAIWVAPCPIPNTEMRAGARRRRRTRERMADRTRKLQPLLPLLVDHVESEHQHLTELLAAGTQAEADELVAVGSRTYRRLFTAGDRAHQRQHGRPNIRLRDEETAKVINATMREDITFWAWAVVETLRLTGVRIEELLELSQLSIRQYQRPNGEVIALLVIAPSKTDRERVIPMSAELLHVIACIIRRLTRDRSTVRLATRFDKIERVTSDPQPFLFQRRLGQRNEVLSNGAVNEMLRRTCARVAQQHPEFAGLHFSPHDFRRLFATDLVNHGLPIHIGAALLGHLNLETTRGYVAVFNEDVVRHYQAHLARRRQMRPTTEYRPVTDDEWVKFEVHFDKRKVELGNCGRPYATPCEHEHACLRCPMLHIDPKMIRRLDEIETDLHTRRARAQDEGWLGELEGIDLTLTFLDGKRADAKRLSQLPPTRIGPQHHPEATP